MDMQTWRSSSVVARDACESLRAALARLGIPERDLSGLRPRVHASGRPMVVLGTLRADVVEKVTEALQGKEPSERR